MAEKTQDVYVMETVSPAEVVWEHEELVVKHTEVLHKHEVTPVLLSGATGPQTREDQNSFKGEMSSPETPARKEATMSNHRVIPRTGEARVVVLEAGKQVTEEEFVVREEASVSRPPDKDVSKQETRLIVKKEKREAEGTTKTIPSVPQAEPPQTISSSQEEAVEQVKDRIATCISDPVVIVQEETRAGISGSNKDGASSTVEKYKSAEQLKLQGDKAMEHETKRKSVAAKPERHDRTQVERGHVPKAKEEAFLAQEMVPEETGENRCIETQAPPRGTDTNITSSHPTHLHTFIAL